MPKTTILVTDVHQIGGLGVVHSLGAAEYLVSGTAPSKWLSVVGCRSRFLHERLVSPSPWASPAEYSDWIVSTCKQRQFDMVLPTSEASLIAAGDAVHRGALQSSRIVGSPHVSLHQCLDYEAVVATLARSGIQDIVAPGCPSSLELALYRGRSLPTILVDRIEGRSSRRLRASALVTRYGNLYPGEIQYLALLRKNAQGSRQANLLDGILAVVKNQIDPRIGRNYFRWSDPRPGITQLRTMFRRACVAVVRHLRPDGRHRQLLQNLSKHRELPRTPIRYVLFLCRGNICRSYLAAERFSNLIARSGMAIEIRSAGIDRAGGYRPPEKFRRLFERFGRSIDEHRSHALDEKDLARADLVIVMDQHNIASLQRRGIEIDRRFYLLGVFGNHDEIEIADPVGTKPHEAVGILGRVDYCVARLAEVVQSGNPT